MNNDTVSGKFDQVAGKVKESVGEAVGNQNMANSGAADQVKGNAKETWGDVKDTASDVSKNARDNTSSTDSTGHDARNRVTSAAENLKNSIGNKLDEFKSEHNR